MLDSATTRASLLGFFNTALRSVDPLNLVANFLPPRPKGRVLVLGAGKASARMALAVEQCWPGKLAGLVITRYQHAEVCTQIEIVEAAHPVPNQAGFDATQRMLKLAQTAGPDDLVLCLVSGGGSSLLTMPAPGVSLEDKQQVNRALLASGAHIGEMNCVRRHLSAVKNGRLGMACGRARVLTLIISDVPDDDASVVASGPTLADASTADDALEILARYNIALPQSVATALKQPVRSTEPRSVGQRDHYLIATANDALNAVHTQARQDGWHVVNWGSAIEGEAREAGKVMAGLVKHLQYERLNAGSNPTPLLVLSGGETTVTLRHPKPGRGGRNVEFLLSLGLQAQSLPNLTALACDTDGIDGSQASAGAVWDTTTLQRAQSQGLSPLDYLHRHDAHTFFETLGDLVITGPTRTNVNDFRAIAIT
jgi:glycerate 2-kinase